MPGSSAVIRFGLSADGDTTTCRTVSVVSRCFFSHGLYGITCRFTSRACPRNDRSSFIRNCQHVVGIGFICRVVDDRVRVKLASACFRSFRIVRVDIAYCHIRSVGFRLGCRGFRRFTARKSDDADCRDHKYGCNHADDNVSCFLAHCFFLLNTSLRGRS